MSELARRALALGGYISFSGVITFKKSEELRAIARDLPLDRILVETDAPFLAPEPFRGKSNEPAYVVHTAAALAKARGISTSDVAAATTAPVSMQPMADMPSMAVEHANNASVDPSPSAAQAPMTTRA